MSIKYSYTASRSFVKNWARLDARIKKEVTEKVDVFLKNPFSPNLKTHKLAGKIKDYWSFSISYRLRILFRFEGKDKIEFIDIGGHEIYK